MRLIKKMKTLFNQQGVIHTFPLLIIIAAVGIISFLLITATAPFNAGIFNTINPKPNSNAQVANNSFLETFDGAPSAPSPIQNFPWSKRWDISILNNGEFDANYSNHGDDCAPPPAEHVVHNVDEAVYQCKDHIMTAVLSGYSAVYMSPNHMVDFSQGEGSIRWDLNTGRTTDRDWIDINVQPFNSNNQIPFNDAIKPNNAVVVHMINAVSNTSFDGEVFRNFTSTGLPLTPDATTLNSIMDPYGGVSLKRRDTFELKLSRTHVKFCIVSVNFSSKDPGPKGETVPIAINACWIDTTIPDLGWDKGVVQLNHYDYNGAKTCPERPTHCGQTWHWDNVSISPATPFTIIQSDRRIANNSNPKVIFSSPAPANAFLRFMGRDFIGGGIRYSLNGGKTWLNASRQPDGAPGLGTEHYRSFWTAIPAGTTSVMFDGDHIEWSAEGVSIWSLNSPSSTTTPSSYPSCPKKLLGDINCDGFINLFDYSALVSNFGKTVPVNTLGDLNGDGVVNLLDYSILVTNFGK